MYGKKFGAHLFGRRLKLEQKITKNDRKKMAYVLAHSLIINSS